MYIKNIPHPNHTTTPTNQPPKIHQPNHQVVVAAVAEPYRPQADPDALYLTPYYVPFEGRFGGQVLFDVRAYVHAVYLCCT